MTLPLPKSHQMLRRRRPDKVSPLYPLTHFRRAPVTIACVRLPLLARDFEPLIVEGPGTFTVVPEMDSSLSISS